MAGTTHFPLLEFLSNDYLLMQTTPYFLPHETLNLGLCSKQFYDLLFHTSGVFRHVDISLNSVVPVNQIRQPVSLRRNYIDILFSPLLGKHTQTLVLDGLPMNFDNLNKLLLSPHQRISILSVRDCPLNQPVFMQTLHFLVRPGSTSPLKGVYFFGKSNGKARSKNMWQRTRSGEIEFIEGWAETVLACEGKIVFDVGLCYGSKHMNFQPLEDGSTISAAADIELGSTPVSVESGFSSFAWSANDSEQSSVTSSSISEDSWNLPQAAPKLAMKKIEGCCEGCKMPPVGCSSKLYAPVPVLTSDIRIACRPRLGEKEETHMCEECTKNRLCECCGKWWCENCYDSDMARACGINKGGVLLDCYDCGRTCYDCKKDTLRRCKKCSNTFCSIHDAGGSDLYCDWCYK
ncbi:hypothetical protein H072_2733 [Dactylellina haptotyla CBS 200.50]|uniref:Uncharacterized protein n=1 Tax=Dactylellina haptotyla (strain CBS 200.50) TaxID=1284197 RepID=S8C682_DACHA|nr:hypothetical protein H072_2733 [Dactylellina haptotyla CBS 200.50]